MKRSGKVVWINPTTEVLTRRLSKERDERPLLRSVAESELAGFIQKKMADRRLYYEQAHLRFDQETIDLTAVLNAIQHV